MKKRFCSIVLALTLATALCLSQTITAFGASRSKISAACTDCGDYIYKTLTEPTYGSIGGEWAMIGFAKAGYSLPDSYIKKYMTGVEEAFKVSEGNLSSRKYTEYSRVILAYSALGLDVTNIYGYNPLEKLADFDKVVWQGINGPIFALRALDSGSYEIPGTVNAENVTTREKLIAYILENQLDDGGWAIAGTASDPDVTAMAVESLAPYYYKQEKVRKAIDKAIIRLSLMQSGDGGYLSGGYSNSESCSQVVAALISVGINPNTDSRFKKNGKSVMDALLSFRDEKTGGFKHTKTLDQMATEQAYYALAVYRNTAPDKASMSSLTTPKRGSLKAVWKKTSVALGYQVKIATNSSFTKGVKTYTVSGRSSVSKTVTGLTKGKTYYVKVRAYKTVNGHKLYGYYSAYKKIKV